jgi:hypothetical protein
MRPCVLSVGLVLILGGTGVAGQVAHPDPRVRAFEESNRSRIEELSSRALSTAAGADERSAALRDLALLSESEAISAAARLVKDPAPEVALSAVRLLDSSVVLMDHSHLDHASVWSKYVHSQHELAVQALGAAARDGRPQIRIAALKPLVRLGVPAAADLVRSAVSSRLLTDVEGVKLCAQGNNVVTRACLIDFLNSGSVAGKIAAVHELGATEAERPFIRNKILLNTKAEPPLRAAAAEVLGKYDPEFSRYALVITADPTTPPIVWSKVLQAHAAQADATGKLDSAQRANLLRAVESKLKSVERGALASGEAIDSLRQLRNTIRAGEQIRF